MKTISDIRRDNARQLAEKCESKQEFSARIDRESTQVSRFIGKNPTKNIGDSLARHIEKCFNLPTGWMDNDHSISVREPGAEYAVNRHPVVPVYTIRDLDIGKKGSEHATLCPFTCGPNTFALLVEGAPGAANPMHPQYGKAYPTRSIVFADPAQVENCENGDIVIAELTERPNKVTAFRQLYREAGTEALRPLNPQFPMTTEPFRIVAKVIGALLP